MAKCSLISLNARLQTAIEHHIDSKIYAHRCNLHDDKEACKKFLELNERAVEEYENFRNALGDCLKENK